MFHEQETSKLEHGMHQTSPASVVVGIDGSESALRACRWAVDEAASSGLPLRLIHVIEPGSEAIRLEIEYAEASLRAACAAVDAAGRLIRVEAIVVRGGINAVLTEESHHAALMCVGSSGVDYPHGKPLGSVARAMAHSAHCPTAVIRTVNVRNCESRCIAVVVGDPNTADAVLRMAMDEARLRTASLLILRIWPASRAGACDDHLDRRMLAWQRRYPDVEVHPVAVHTSLAEFLTETDRSVQLAIVDTASANEATRIVGPAVVSRARCSVLVVNPDHSAGTPRYRPALSNASLRRLRPPSSSSVVDQAVSAST